MGVKHDGRGKVSRQMTDRFVRDLVKRPTAIHIGPDAMVREACKLMAEHGIGAVLVMRDAAIEGIFTERDALNRVLAEGRDPDETRVGAVMTPEPVTLTPEATAVDALRLMTQIGFRHLPIAEEGRVYGIISMRDFVGAELQQAGEDG